MTDVLAAIGVAQLERYDQMLDRRHQLIKLYNEELRICLFRCLITAMKTTAAAVTFTL